MSKLLQTLQTQLDQTTKPRERVNLMNDMAFEVRDNDPAMLREIAEEALNLAQEEHYLHGEGYARAHLGYYFSIQGDRETAHQQLESAQKIMLQMGENEGVALTHLYYGFLYWDLGDLNQALEEVGQAMKYTQGPTSIIRGWCLYLLGVFYIDLKNYDKAVQYLQQAVPVFESQEHEHGLGRTFNAMSKVYLDTKKLDKAQEYGMLSRKVHRSSGYAVGVARSYHDLGVIALEEKAYEEARYFLNKSLEIRRDSENFSGIISTLTDLGQVYFAEGHYQSVIQQAQEALSLAKEKEAKGKMDRIIRLLVQCYTAMGMLDEAVAQYESLFEIGTTNETQTAKTRITEIENKFQAEKRKQEAEIYRLKNVALKKAYEEIQDSLHYARRMQEVFLPSDDRLKRMFPNSFSWFQPREVLSGDFFWLATTQEHTWFAVADSTGRGVPSAMFSSVIIHALHYLLYEERHSQPHELIQALHEILYVQFNKEKGGKGADHVAISICKYHPESQKLAFSSADQSVFYVKGDEVVEYRSHRHPLGDSAEAITATTEVLTVNPNDRLYLITDGLANQFGGEEGHRLMKKGVKEMILSLQKDPMNLQGKELNKLFRSWKGMQRQVDDICALGIEF
ncbi:MAG TPA: hypothetical protein DCP28_21815 [Cytophagales bacterium]|nr:hypothetical protein [Cytophagales bacterium]